MEGDDMSIEDLLDRIEELFELNDILYIIGKDRRWLLQNKLLPYILEHREDFGDRLEENKWPSQEDL
jgi:hypothetical protein